MGFDTSVRDEAVRRTRMRREALRREVLDATLAALGSLPAELRIEEAYVFGSVANPGTFREQSDIDIAVSPIVDTLRLATHLSAELGREVHVVELDDSNIARTARQKGLRWTPAS